MKTHASFSRRVPFAPALLAMVLAASPVFAAEAETAATQAASTEPTPEARQEAGKRYETGLGLYSEGEFKLAVIEFERAYQLVPDYRVLYNIGQVRIQLGNYARARMILEQYLKDGGDKIGEDRKKAVQNDLTMLEGRTATLRVETNLAGAEVFVDDVSFGKAPLEDALLLDAGDHRVVVRIQGHEPGESVVTLAGRDQTSIRVDVGRPIDTSRSVVVVDRQSRDDSSRKAWTWAMWSATGVFAIGAGVTGFLGIRAANDLDELRDQPGATRDELDSAQRRARTLLFTADALGIAAIASGGVAIYLTLSGPSDPEKDSKKKAKSARLVPVLAPNYVGLNGNF